MDISLIKNYVKKNPRLECLYMTVKALRDIDLAKKMVGVKRSPNNLILNHYGKENPDKIIYYILFDEEARYNGFCSLYRQMLLHLAYAEDLNLVPVICFGPNSLYYDRTITECTNAFDYFFEPVSKISSDEAKKSKNVIISKGADAKPFGTTDSYLISDNEIYFLSNFCRKYIKLNSKTKDLFWDDMKIIINGGSTLGVHVRATDFNVGYNRHPVVVSPKEYLEKTKQIYASQGFKKVFLATDDKSIVELFKNEYNDNLCYYSDTYRSNDGSAIHYGKQDIVREHHKYRLGLEIIRDFYTLGHCAGLIAGNSNVSICARIIKKSLTEEYRFLEIIDKGVNHNMHETRGLLHSMLKNTSQISK